MTATFIAQYMGQGLAAARPVTPLVTTGALAIYQATDTGVLSTYYGGAWHTFTQPPGTPPTVIQSKLAVATSASITLNSGPINGNLLVAMFFNPTVGTVGAGWTLQTSNGTGTDFGVIATKVAGVAESATQSPLSGSATGVIAMWELNGQAGANFVVASATQAMQSSLVSASPQFPNLLNCLCLGAVDLVSTSNSINALFNMTQDQIINSGTTRQAVMGHSDASVPIGMPLVNFTGAGTPGNKSAIILITR